MFRLIDEQWDKQFDEASKEGADVLRIICPFIKDGALKKLLSRRHRKIQVITRFNLEDFAAGVSDINALRRLLDAGATVRGVKNLHAKLYIFGESRAIITSANLTEAAMARNHELGVVSDNAKLVKKCCAYFNKLWKSAAGSDLDGEQLESWGAKVRQYQLGGGRPNDAVGLGDFGVTTRIVESSSDRVPLVITGASQAFVKLLGSAESRSPLTTRVLEEIKSSGCHWAVCYPARRRPTGVRDDDIIFMGRLTENPIDIRVFGYAIGMAHKEGRDDATSSDIARRAWKNRWPRYIRVHDAKFVNGALADGISLYEMMDVLEENSVASTQENAAKGDGSNTNPRRAFMQRPDIRLSTEGRMWLYEKLQEAFEKHGKVSQVELDELDWPDLSDIPMASE